jgi:hypothetical protein
MNENRTWRVEMSKEYRSTYGGALSGWVARLYAPGMLIGGPAFSVVYAITKTTCRKRAKETIAAIEAKQEDGPDTFYVPV